MRKFTGATLLRSLLKEHEYGHTAARAAGAWFDSGKQFSREMAIAPDCFYRIATALT